MKYFIILMLSVSFSGCIKDSKILIGKSNPEYVGLWYILDEKSEKDYYHLKSVAFEVQENGNSSYFKCVIVEDSRGNGHSTSRTSVFFPDSRVIKIMPGKIVLEQSLYFLHIESSLDVPSIPFIESESEYLLVEGYKLKKTTKEVDLHCPESKT